MKWNSAVYVVTADPGLPRLPRAQVTAKKAPEPEPEEEEQPKKKAGSGFFSFGGTAKVKAAKEEPKKEEPKPVKRAVRWGLQRRCSECDAGCRRNKPETGGGKQNSRDGLLEWSLQATV